MRVCDWDRLVVILTRAVQKLPRDSEERAHMFGILERFKSSVKRDRKIVMTGVSGSGKSTLLNELMQISLLPAEQADNDGDAVTYFPTEIVSEPSLADCVVIEARYIKLGDFLATHNKHAQVLKHLANPDEGEQPSDADTQAADSFFANVLDVFGDGGRDALEPDAVTGATTFLRGILGTRETVTLSGEALAAARGGEVQFESKKRFFSCVTQHIRVRGNFAPVIPAGVCIVDCPGADDQHPVRSLNRIDALRNAFAMISVVNLGGGSRFRNRLVQSVLPEITEHNPRLRQNCIVVAKNVLPAKVNGRNFGSVLGGLDAAAARQLLVEKLSDPAVAEKAEEIFKTICGDSVAPIVAVVESVQNFDDSIVGGVEDAVVRLKRAEILKITSFLSSAERAEHALFLRTFTELLNMCCGFFAPRPMRQVPAAAAAGAAGGVALPQPSRAIVHAELSCHLRSFAGRFCSTPDRVQLAFQRATRELWHHGTIRNFGNYGGKNGGSSKYRGDFHRELVEVFIGELTNEWSGWVTALNLDENLSGSLRRVSTAFNAVSRELHAAFYTTFATAFQSPVNEHDPHFSRGEFGATAVRAVCQRWTDESDIARDIFRLLLQILQREVNNVAFPLPPAIQAVAELDRAIGELHVRDAVQRITLSPLQWGVVQSFAWFSELAQMVPHLKLQPNELVRRFNAAGLGLISQVAAVNDNNNDAAPRTVPFLQPQEVLTRPQWHDEGRQHYEAPGATLFIPTAHGGLQMFSELCGSAFVDNLEMPGPLAPLANAPDHPTLECVVCLADEATVSFLPCLCKVLCVDCLPLVLARGLCPNCRGEITSSTTD